MRRAQKKRQSVLEIVGVQREASISEIRSRTGLDSEEIRAIIVSALLSHQLFGYLEDDIFVRDISGRPHLSSESQQELFGD